MNTPRKPNIIHTMPVSYPPSAVHQNNNGWQSVLINPFVGAGKLGEILHLHVKVNSYDQWQKPNIFLTETENGDRIRFQLSSKKFPFQIAINDCIGIKGTVQRIDYSEQVTYLKYVTIKYNSGTVEAPRQDKNPKYYKKL